MNTQSSISSAPRRLGVSLTVFLGVCGLAGSGMANAQDTAGSVFGNAPAGDSVAVLNAANGVQREVRVRADGRYVLRALPSGVYLVTLLEAGKRIVEHPKVQVTAGRGSKVDFDCSQGGCGHSENNK